MASMKEKRAKALVKKGKTIRQVAVLPYRKRDGDLQVLLLTSRQTKRFVIPKGWPMKGLSDWEAAVVEAKQEAGLVGKVDDKPYGSYSYWKRLKTIFIPVTVTVYGLRVTQELAEFREKDQRERAWVTPQQARMLVDEPHLISLIALFEEQLAGQAA
ncbi:NUDIX hydrolase [Tianweitania sp. BSSL-BM11]|uniref:NUDIX hydrolase n=2 Tax=Tianweitania aestuarii TaxID=2814886 RepID=A0ABS5RSW0_9HYPH|nr:NUDIX hydrolase [Tianweitania aestuarii]MBS9719371.1 NUDIX hydrolase [Tianweitania aestuarii]